MTTRSAPVTAPAPAPAVPAILITVAVDAEEVWSAEGTPTVRWHCPACDEYAGPDQVEEEDRLYECASDNGCGATFRRSNGQGRQGTLCPDCGKFGTKLGEGKICPACDAGLLEEVDEVSYTCSACDEVLADRDAFLEHVRDSHLGEAL